uniref:Protein FMP32, mitochondrial n=1 Tax=Vitis vinifera TaxID=29760 RepID=F6GWS6_VITVI
MGTALYKFKAFSVEGKSNTTSVSSPFGYCRRSDYRPFSQFVKSSGGRLFPVDTLAQKSYMIQECNFYYLSIEFNLDGIRELLMTSTKTEVLTDSLENVAQSLVSKGEIQKIEMTQESNLSKFKSEVESSQGHHFSLLQHETKKLQSDMEKMHNKLRYETDDVTIAIRAEFAYHKAKTDHMYNKLDRGIHALSAEIEATKYDVIKYFIGTIVYISTVGVAVIFRALQKGHDHEP